MRGVVGWVDLASALGRVSAVPVGGHCCCAGTRFAAHVVTRYCRFGRPPPLAGGFSLAVFCSAQPLVVLR